MVDLRDADIDSDFHFLDRLMPHLTFIAVIF